MPEKRSLLIGLGLALALAAAGCGGGAKVTTPESQTIAGEGFAFDAPAGWEVVRQQRSVAVRRGEGPDLVSVTVLPLRRRYEPGLFARVAKELDQVTADLADRLGGRVAASRTVQAAERKARQYDVAYRRSGAALVDRITFVLRGKTEYELICRWLASEAMPPACGRLVTTFRLQ